MKSDMPRVSIGLAVYNGEPYLEQAIDSILAQTYTDFELILSDNASTDATEVICRKYAAQDSRIRYFRNQENIGGANNENQTFKFSRGEYFRWAAHDDTCAPELISKCVAILDSDPTVILCYSMLVEINEVGDQIRTVSQKKGMSLKPYERFCDLAAHDHNCEATYGLIRADILRKTRLQQNYTDSDRTLLCELSLYGKFYEIPELLFYKRYHSENTYVDMRARMAWFNPRFKGKIVFPYWMQLLDYLKTIKRADIPGVDKYHCYTYMFRWVLEHGRNLSGDLLLALIAWIKRTRDPYGWRHRDSDLYNWE